MIRLLRPLALPIDILINNAGITRDGLMMRMKDEDWDAVMEVNLNAAMVLSRSVLRRDDEVTLGTDYPDVFDCWLHRQSGAGQLCRGKAGMTGFTKALAAEVASRGITANVVAPGFIATPMTDALTDAQKDDLLVKVPAGRLGQAQEIAAAAVYLASEEAGYMTGATLHVNGGMAML